MCEVSEESREEGTQNTGRQSHLQASTQVPPCQKAIPRHRERAHPSLSKARGIKWKATCPSSTFKELPAVKGSRGHLTK